MAKQLHKRFSDEQVMMNDNYISRSTTIKIPVLKKGAILFR